MKANTAILFLLVICLCLASCSTGFSVNKTSTSNSMIGESAQTSDQEDETTNVTMTDATTRSVTEVTTAEPTPEMTTEATTIATKSIKEQKADCEEINYKSIMRHPEEYVLRSVLVEGEVLQVIIDGDFTAYRVAEDDDYDKIWMIILETNLLDERLLEDDPVRFWGVCTDLYTYETVRGDSLSIPCALAFAYKRIED